MYLNKLNAKQILAKSLFQKFKVVFLTHQHRASGSPLQQFQLDQLRVLPPEYPFGYHWKRGLQFYPLNDDIIKKLLSPITSEDISNDPKWIDSSVILVTGNAERAIMNSTMAQILANRMSTILYRWRKPMKNISSDNITYMEYLYDEDIHPTLFGYFFKGATAQILDNKNGNVSLGIANGTMCKYHSMAWSDRTKTDIIRSLTTQALLANEDMVELPFPPDFINVTILDHNLEPVNASTWPLHNDLITSNDEVVNNHLPQHVVVPIGLIKSKDDQFTIKIVDQETRENVKLYYYQHAVDLALSLTIWKAQGATFNRVLLLLEGSPKSPAWKFEHIYVAISRIRSADHLRCIPLSFTYDRSKLGKLRPSIYTIKWQMDLNHEGKWQQRPEL